MRYAFSAIVLGVAIAAAGCMRAQTATREWSATAEVRGNSAVIHIDVPGWTMGADYHPHLSLNGGSVVMSYVPVYTFSNLKPGRYRIQIAIADPVHNPIPGMEKTLEIDVK